MRGMILCLAGLMALLVFFGQAMSQSGQGPDLSGRQAEVARRGTGIMPFDLEKTLHRFQKTPEGGVQIVWSIDPGNDDQAEKIRGHLKELAASFARGDFSAPRSVHGSDMPGVATLERAGPALAVHYASQADGASLTFTGKTPEIVAAIHAFFDAQNHDHGRHAVQNDDGRRPNQNDAGHAGHSGHAGHGS